MLKAVKKAVFPVAGLGARRLTATKADKRNHDPLWEAFGNKLSGFMADAAPRKERSERPEDFAWTKGEFR